MFELAHYIMLLELGPHIVHNKSDVSLIIYTVVDEVTAFPRTQVAQSTCFRMKVIG